MAERHFLDDVGIVAWPAEPLIHDIDEPDVVWAIESCVHEVGPIDVEDDESSGAGCRAASGLDRDVALLHTVIMTRGCNTVLSRPITLTYPLSPNDVSMDLLNSAW